MQKDQQQNLLLKLKWLQQQQQRPTQRVFSCPTLLSKKANKGCFFFQVINTVNGRARTLEPILDSNFRIWVRIAAFWPMGSSINDVIGNWEGSNIGQNFWKIVLKTLDMGEEGVKNQEKIPTLFMDGPYPCDVCRQGFLMCECSLFHSFIGKVGV